MSAYSAVSFGHAHPRIVARARRPGAAARRHLARLPQRRVARAVRAPRATDGARSRAAGERRRGGGRDRVEGRAQMGAQGQGNSRRSRRDHRLRRQLPRPHDRHDRLVDGAPVPRRLRPVSARPVARFRIGDADALARAITPRTAAFLVEPIQGEGGIVVPPEGYLARCARDLPRAQRAADLRRDPDGHWGAPASSSPASTTA